MGKNRSRKKSESKTFTELKDQKAIKRWSRYDWIFTEKEEKTFREVENLWEVASTHTYTFSLFSEVGPVSLLTNPTDISSEIYGTAVVFKVTLFALCCWAFISLLGSCGEVGRGYSEVCDADVVHLHRHREHFCVWKCLCRFWKSSDSHTHSGRFCFCVCVCVLCVQREFVCSLCISSTYEMVAAMRVKMHFYIFPWKTVVSVTGIKPIIYKLNKNVFFFI